MAHLERIRLTHLPPQRPDRDPPPLLQGAGLVALILLAFLDAWSASWNPDERAYLAAIVLLALGYRRRRPTAGD